MGKPEHPEEYVCFQDGDIEIYLARDVFDKLEPETAKLLFAVQDYGRFWLYFKDEKPKRGIKNHGRTSFDKK